MGTVPPAEVWEFACPDNGWGEEESKPIHPCKGKKITEYPAMIVEKAHPEVCDFLKNKTVQDVSGPSSDHIRGHFGSFFAPKRTTRRLSFDWFLLKIVHPLVQVPKGMASARSRT